MKTRQQTLWDWAHASAQHYESLVKPHVRGKLTLGELPAAPAAVMFNLIRSARELHVFLEGELGEVDLIITDNRRRMVSARRRGKAQEVRLHHMFLGCDEDVIGDLAKFARGDDAARERIQRFIQENRDAIRHEVEQEQLRSLGRYHDLEWLLKTARALLVEAQLDDVVLDEVTITWGRHGKGKRTIRFGSYDFEQRLVRIHPTLDQRWVPSFFIEYIIYHELLHALYPPTTSEEGSGRRCVHTEEFKEMEQRYPRYEEALAWEAAHIHRLLDLP